jgi:hypothetical protein
MRYPQVIVLPFFGVVMIILGVWWLLKAADVDTDDLVHAGPGVYYSSGFARFRGLWLIILGIAFIIMGVLI